MEEEKRRRGGLTYKDDSNLGSHGEEFRILEVKMNKWEESMRMIKGKQKKRNEEEEGKEGLNRPPDPVEGRTM